MIGRKDKHAVDVRLDPGPGGPTLSIRTPDGRWLQYHSRRDPVAEADRLVAPAFASGTPPVVVLVGSGLGYLIDAVERRSPDTRIITLEPWPVTIPMLHQRRDWTAAIDGGRLLILEGPEYGGRVAAATRLGDHDAPVIVHPIVEREFAGEAARARAVVSQLIDGARANAEARRAFAGRYLRNVLINTPVIVREADAGCLAGLAHGLPAVVVAAGPSLDDNLPALQRYHGRALIIAVDTALRPLVAAGIRPHLVVGVDPSEINARHLTDLPDVSDVHLVAEGSLNPRVFPAFAGRTFTFKVSHHHPWPWLAAYGAGRATLKAWGSVLTTAFDVACLTGADPIVFAGADLAYTKGLLYCRNTAYEPEWAHLDTDDARAREFAPLMTGPGRFVTTDVTGGHVTTAGHFVQFRDWIAARAAEVPGRRVVNGTGAGILEGRAIDQADLAEVPLADGVDAGAVLRDRVAARWAASVTESPADGLRLAGAADDVAHGASPLDQWVAFAAEPSSAAWIRPCLEHAARTLEGRPHRRERLRRWADLRAESRVLVAGGGGPARDLRRRLAGARRDVVMLGFLADGGPGSLDGFPVLPGSRTLESDYDTVLAPESAPPDDNGPCMPPPDVPVTVCDPALWRRRIGEYSRLETVVGDLFGERPVLIAGPGAALTDEVSRRYAVVAVSEVGRGVPRADVVVLLNLQKLLSLVFDAEGLGRWGRVLVPDGLMKRFPDPHPAGRPFGPDACAGLVPEYRDAWGWDRLVPFEQVDRLVDFGWIAERLVCGRLENVYADPSAHPEWTRHDPGLQAFDPAAMSPGLVKSACNPTHLGICLAYHAGIRHVHTAAVDETRVDAVLARLGMTRTRLDEDHPA